MILLLAEIAGAAAPEVGPTATVRAALDKASAAAAPSQTRDEQLAALRVVARELVDTDSMGRRALGDAFRNCTEPQRQEFLRLFNELFLRSYLQKLLLFRQPKFRVGDADTRGDTVVVSTQVVTGEDAYGVDYEMRHEHDQWRAADVVVEGVSMTSNYSDQFAGLLRDRSFDGLLELMRSKLDRVAGKDAP